MINTDLLDGLSLCKRIHAENQDCFQSLDAIMRLQITSTDKDSDSFQKITQLIKKVGKLYRIAKSSHGTSTTLDAQYKKVLDKHYKPFPEKVIVHNHEFEKTDLLIAFNLILSRSAKTLKVEEKKHRSLPKKVSRHNPDLDECTLL